MRQPRPPDWDSQCIMQEAAYCEFALPAQIEDARYDIYRWAKTQGLHTANLDILLRFLSTVMMITGRNRADT
jgi:hypothetical protein